MTLSGVVLFAATAWAAGAKAPVPPVPKPPSAQSVTLKTSDRWRLHARWRAPEAGMPLVILVHGVASDGREWDAFAKELWGLGAGTLALDLRGHGKSLSGPSGRTDYKGFDASGEWPKAERDLLAALAFAHRKKAASVGLIGASIGANLASRVYASTTAVAWAVLLSPGNDYRGVALARELDGRPLVLAASSGDPHAWVASIGLARKLGKEAVFFEAKSGHGVQMFEDPAFRRKLLDWIEAKSNMIGP